MPGITRTLTFAEGVETTGPTTTFLQTTEFATFADDATYVSNKGSAAEDGDAYYNTTSDLIRVYADGAWVNYIDESTAQTLTNKTLTSPKINEAVALTSTATELNQLDDVSVGGNASGDILTTDDTQTLTNKTLTSPGVNGANQNMGTASNTNRIILPQDTTAHLDLLTDTAGLVAYDTTLSQMVYNNGSGWQTLTSITVSDWQSYTPALTNLTLGNGTLDSYYRRVNDTAEIYIYFQMGSTSVMGTSPTFGLPSGLSRDGAKQNNLQSLGAALCEDAGTAANNTGGIVRSTSNTLYIFGYGFTVINATTPFTWTTGDKISFECRVPISGW